MTQRQKVHQHISDSQPQHLERVREFMAQPSVSQESQGVEECAVPPAGAPPPSTCHLRAYVGALGCPSTEVVCDDDVLAQPRAASHTAAAPSLPEAE